MATLPYTEPNICVDENLTLDQGGLPWMQPWSVPTPVADVYAPSGGDGRIIKPLQAPPGKLLIDARASWRNNTPLAQPILIRVTRGPRRWITSNPNAIQFRDRWTYAVDAEPSEPLTTSISNGQCGSALDLGTNSVAEPEPGVQWMWTDTNTFDEWVPYLLEPNQLFTVWYRCYVWTPPPWSDNANKNSPVHEAYANWARVTLWRWPQQGSAVSG